MTRRIAIPFRQSRDSFRSFIKILPPQRMISRLQISVIYFNTGSGRKQGISSCTFGLPGNQSCVHGVGCGLPVDAIPEREFLIYAFLSGTENIQPFEFIISDIPPVSKMYSSCLRVPCGAQLVTVHGVSGLRPGPVYSAALSDTLHTSAEHTGPGRRPPPTP